MTMRTKTLEAARVGFVPAQRAADKALAVVPLEAAMPVEVEVPTCYECGDDDGLCLDCQEELGFDADLPDPRLPAPMAVELSETAWALGPRRQSTTQGESP